MAKPKLKRVGTWMGMAVVEDKRGDYMLVGGAMQAREAVLPVGASSDPGEGFRSLTQQSERDLTPLSQERMIEIAYWLKRTNPLAAGVLETTRDFVVGEGISFDAKHPKVGEILKAFWDDPVNQMDLSLPKFVLELGMYGEQCYPIFVGTYSGNVRLGYVDPANIKEVAKDPENAKMNLGVALKSKGNKKGKRYKIALQGDPEDVLAPAGLALYETFTDGECHFFPINNVTNASRGESDLLNLADWADAYEQFLYDRIDMRSLVNSFIWDTKVEGATQEQIDELKKKTPPPKRGTEFWHNERVTRQAIAPDLKADDASKDATVFKNHILGAKGLPPPWFGEGGDVNRATASEMEPRIIKMLTARQTIVKAMVRAILIDVLRKKIAAGELEEELPILDENGEETAARQKSLEAFSVVAPDISVKDVLKMAQALQPVAVSLMTAETQGWISKQDAAKFFAMLISQFGMKIEPPKPEETDPNVTKDYRSQEARDRIRRAYAGR